MTNKVRDAVATMGTILTDVKVGTRDAVHVACIAVTSDRIWKPGDDVGVDANMVSRRANPVGKVDPFLKENVKHGDTFWLYLYPRTITGLNHHWTHPAFPESQPHLVSLAVDAEKKKNAIEWLNKWLRDRRLEHWDYTGPLLAGQLDHYDGEICFPYDVDGDREFTEEFWDKVEIALDRKIEKRPDYYRCAC